MSPFPFFSNSFEPQKRRVRSVGHGRWWDQSGRPSGSQMIGVVEFLFSSPRTITFAATSQRQCTKLRPLRVSSMCSQVMQRLLVALHRHHVTTRILQGKFGENNDLIVAGAAHFRHAGKFPCQGLKSFHAFRYICTCHARGPCAVNRLANIK